MSRPVACERCGEPVLVAESNGATVLLDRGAPVFRVIQVGAGRTAKLRAEKMSQNPIEECAAAFLAAHAWRCTGSRPGARPTAPNTPTTVAGRDEDPL